MAGGNEVTVYAVTIALCIDDKKDKGLLMESN